MAKKERGIHELYASDPELADYVLWNRRTDKMSRRGFLKDGGRLSMSAILGLAIPFAHLMPRGLIPVALADSTDAFAIEGKTGLIVLNDRPVNAETPAHLLDDDVTPAEHLFVRNNGLPPSAASLQPDAWQLTVSGEAVESPATFSIADLKHQFKHYTYSLQLECGGNGRSEFVPAAPGNQWTLGAVGCPKWTGIRLRDLLDHVGIKPNAVYVGYYGSDTHISGDTTKAPISRGVPIKKALEKESLVAWSMNGEDIPMLNGYPLRLVIGGWPGSVSGKWLSQIVVRDRVHDGEKMGGSSYRVPCKPVAPGTEVPSDQMCIIESMPVKSLITRPRSGIRHALGEDLTVRGHAWAGDLSVSAVHVSIDFGATWHPASLSKPVNRLAWQRWSTKLRFPQKGYYEVWARATDTVGHSQPMVIPGWNPKGYLNNASHRIAVEVI